MIMKNKKLEKICMVSGLSVAFAALIISAYCIITDDFYLLLHGPKERKARTEQSRIFQEYGNYVNTFYEQQDVEIRSFVAEKTAKSDSMRAVYKQIEKDLFDKADSCYYAAIWYQKQINILNDSIFCAGTIGADTVEFSKKRQQYVNKRNTCLKKYEQYVKEGCEKAIEHTSLMDSFWNNRNYTLQHPKDLKFQRDSIMQGLASQKLR